MGRVKYNLGSNHVSDLKFKAWDLKIGCMWSNYWLIGSNYIVQCITNDNFFRTKKSVALWYIVSTI